MRFRWLGTAGFEFASGDTRLLIDPYLSRNPRSNPRQDLGPADLAQASAILVTHGHFDHAHDVPAIAAEGCCRVLASSQVCRRLRRRGLDGERLVAVASHASYDVGPFRVQAVPSRHVTFDAALIARTALRCLPRLWDLALVNTLRYPAGEVFGYLVEAEGKSLYHIGSAWLDPREVEGWEVDAFFVPVQGRSDIAGLAARMAAELKPRLVVPHHHDDFFPPLSRCVDLHPFEQALFALLPGVRVHAPSINRWVEF